MPQLHLYVSDATAHAVRVRAERAGVPMSRYLAAVVAAAVADEDRWPDGYFEQVVGSVPDFPDVEDPIAEPAPDL